MSQREVWLGLRCGFSTPLENHNPSTHEQHQYPLGWAMHTACERHINQCPSHTAVESTISSLRHPASLITARTGGQADQWHSNHDQLNSGTWRVELNELSQFASPCITPLSRISAYPDYEGVWKWFREHYPQFMKLIPSRRKHSFVDGVRKAFDDEQLIV